MQRCVHSRSRILSQGAVKNEKSTHFFVLFAYNLFVFQAIVLKTKIVMAQRHGLISRVLIFVAKERCKYQETHKFQRFCA